MKWNAAMTKEAGKALGRLGFVIGGPDIYTVSKIKGADGMTFFLVGVLETAENGAQGVRLLLRPTDQPESAGAYPVPIAFVSKVKATVAA